MYKEAKYPSINSNRPEQQNSLSLECRPCSASRKARVSTRVDDQHRSAYVAGGSERKVDGRIAAEGVVGPLKGRPGYRDYHALDDLLVEADVAGLTLRRGRRIRRVTGGKVAAEVVCAERGRVTVSGG